MECRLSDGSHSFPATVEADVAANVQRSSVVQVTAHKIIRCALFCAYAAANAKPYDTSCNLALMGQAKCSRRVCLGISDGRPFMAMGHSMNIIIIVIIVLY